MDIALPAQKTAPLAALQPTKRSILAVEDNDDHFALLELHLDHVLPNAPILRAKTLTEALRLIATAQVELVLLDLDLPDSRGLDTLRGLQAFGPNCPVIVLTSHNDTRIGCASLNLGAADFIDKASLDSANLARQVAFARERFDAARTLEREGELLRGLVLSLGHDLKTPPRQIAALCDQIEDALQSGDSQLVANQLASVRSRCLHLGRLLSDTTRFAKDSTKRPTLARVQLSEIAERVAADFDSERRNRITFTEDCQLTADPALLYLIVHNLVSNGLKYWRGTPSRVRISGQTQGNSSHITVEDTGIGIPTDMQDQVFEPTIRAVAFSEFPGTGFGLSIVRLLTEAHEGQVNMASTPGQGTTITLTFPFHRKRLT